jgi:hypothetical protein
MDAKKFDDLIDQMSTKPVVKTVKKIKKPAKRRSITATAKAQLLAGRSNAQVWSALKLSHHLDESKKWYVAWNRAWLVRRGLLEG